MVCQKIGKHTEIKDNSPATKSDFRMAATLVWFVDDVTFIGYLKIKKVLPRIAELIQ